MGGTHLVDSILKLGQSVRHDYQVVGFGYY